MREGGRKWVKVGRVLLPSMWKDFPSLTATNIKKKNIRRLVWGEKEERRTIIL